MSREVASVRGRLVLDDRIEPGRIAIEDGWIAEIELVEPVDGGAGRTAGAPATEELPYLAPGFVDVHVHGGGGHDAMGGADALDGMARHLLRRGVTGFLPTAVTAPLPALATFAETGPGVAARRARRRRGAARVQPRGPVPRRGPPRRPRSGVPPGARPTSTGATSSRSSTACA